MKDIVSCVLLSVYIDIIRCFCLMSTRSFALVELWDDLLCGPFTSCLLAAYVNNELYTAV